MVEEIMVGLLIQNARQMLGSFESNNSQFFVESHFIGHFGRDIV